MILTEVKKKFEGLLDIFFLWLRFLIVETVRKHVPKIFIFFFSYAFLGWYKVTLNIYKATTTKIRLPASRSPKTWYLIHFRVLIRTPHWLRRSTHPLSVVTQKSVINRSKKLKSVISVIKIRYIQIFPNRFSID